MKKLIGYLLFSLLFLCSKYVLAQNPLIRNQFTADPSARVFGDRVYIYPSHDIVATPGHGRVGWFCMEDYHVFSSADLISWNDHGVILSQRTVPWTDSTAYSMWAPDCTFRNGKYYFYFPAIVRETAAQKGFRIGVAIADHPYGPFTPQKGPIEGVKGIDPNVFTDDDGQAYLYWAQGNIYGAKLKDNMLELASAPLTLEGLPAKGLKEGPYLFKRNGIYYLTYPHAANKTERLEYAMAASPLGPFKYAGVLMDESASGCWTNHQSIIEFKKQWYLFYHNDDLAPHFDKTRSIRADSLFFNADGTIKKVLPTLRGIGITSASSTIEIDRYSEISKSGAFVSFLDSLHTMNGWKVTFNQSHAWVRYNSVQFAKTGVMSVNARAAAPGGGGMEIRLDKPDGPLIAKFQFNQIDNWTVIKTKLLKPVTGRHNLFFIASDARPLDIDWVSFK